MIGWLVLGAVVLGIIYVQLWLRKRGK